MFSNNFKWAFFVILFVLLGVLLKFDPMNWLNTYEVDNSLIATIVTVPHNKTELPEGTIYTVNTGSTLMWDARKVGGFHTGTVTIPSGVVVVSGSDVIGAEFAIDMTSIVVSDIASGDAMNTKLVDELKSFFNVTTYPTAKFFLVSYASGKAQGDLTLNGITKTIEFPAEIVLSGQTATIKANFFIQRSQWNLTKWEGMVQEELNISFDLSATTTEQISVTPSLMTGEVASGSVVSGTVVSGSVMTGEVASGSVVSGTVSTGN